jgi:hypothetical protein
MYLQYGGLFIVILSSFQKFPDEGTWAFSAMYITFCVMMGLAAVLMVVALLKIRSCFIAKGLGN